MNALEELSDCKNLMVLYLVCPSFCIHHITLVFELMIFSLYFHSVIFLADLGQRPIVGSKCKGSITQVLINATLYTVVVA